MSLSDIIQSLEKSLSFSKDVIIGGFKFELTILSYAQDQFINSTESDDEDPLIYYERTRMSILSQAITKISDEPIPDIVEIKEGDKIVTKERAIYIRELLRRIPPKIADKLFDIYVDFKEEIDNKLDTDLEYKWFKTPEQREKERLEERFKKENEKVGEEVEEEEPIKFTKVEEKEDEEIKE